MKSIISLGKKKIHMRKTYTKNKILLINLSLLFILSKFFFLCLQVSWVRLRDIHILTTGAYTYTSDQRFQALHRPNNGQNSEWSEWTLCIKWAQERDQGIYDCQISTIPLKSHQFYLNVVG